MRLHASGCRLVFDPESTSRSIRAPHVARQIRTSGILSVVFLVLLCGCESSTDPVPPGDEDQFVVVHHDGDSVWINLATLPQIDIEGEPAVRLSSLIDTNLVPLFRDKKGVAYDARRLYSYPIVGDDGFSAGTGRGYPNNVWDHLLVGYILTRNRQVIFPKEAIDLAGAYNVKNTAHIFLKRKIDMVLPDSTVFVELDTFTPLTVSNLDGQPEDAISFESMIRTALPQPEGHRYTIQALDGAGPAPMEWSQIRTGYWLLASERSIFTDPALTTGMYKLSALERIIVTQ